MFFESMIGGELLVLSSLDGNFQITNEAITFEKGNIDIVLALLCGGFYYM